VEALLPLGVPPLSTIVSAQWRDRQAEEGSRPKADVTRGRGSQALGCARRIGLETLGFPRDINDTDFNVLAFQAGRFVHDTIQRALVFHKDARLEVPVSYRPSHDVSGSADAVYDEHSPSDTVVEIKSMKQYAFDLATGVKASRWSELPGPKRQHLAQAGLYAGAPQLEAARVHMIYGAKDTGQIAEWVVRVDEPLVHLDGEPTIEELAAGELERFDRIFETLDAGELPARSIPEYGLVISPPAADTKEQPWQCRFCPYQPTCATLAPEAVPVTLLDERRDAATTPSAATDATRQALLALVRALPLDRQAVLRDRWPTDWPMLKNADGWTGELVDKLTRLIATVLDEPLPATRSRRRAPRSPRTSTPSRTPRPPQAETFTSAGNGRQTVTHHLSAPSTGSRAPRRRSASTNPVGNSTTSLATDRNLSGPQ
jgi:hypothetical protein